MVLKERTDNLKSEKPDFDKCEKYATRLLNQQNIKSLKIDVMTLKYDKTIIFDTMQNYERLSNQPIPIKYRDGVLQDGCTIKVKNNLFLILYNERVTNPLRLNWTLAHEVGHIYLGHDVNDSIHEVEAHCFAAQLLMPEIVIRELAAECPDISALDIYFLFNVSTDAAQKRIETLHKKQYYFCDYENRQLLNKCLPLIKEYLNKRALLLA